MAFAMKTHDTEVPAKARRRRFTAEYKQKILREAEHCRKAGEIGATCTGERPPGSTVPRSCFV
jgi:hypothetical protein